MSASATISGRPPWHTSCVIGICLLIALYYVPSVESLDRDLANVAVLTHSVGTISVTTMGWLRILLGSIMMGDSLYVVLWGKWQQDTEYYPGSQLQPQFHLPFRGILVERPYSFSRGLVTLSSFTMWAWVLEGMAFWLLGYIALTTDNKDDDETRLTAAAATATVTTMVPKQRIYRMAAVLWEIAAPTSLLVSSIVKYVLWPLALVSEGNSNANGLKHPAALLEHNLNSLAALVEVGFLGGLPVQMSHASLAVLFGLTYLAYTYVMVHSWPHGTQDKKLDKHNKEDRDMSITTHQPRTTTPSSSSSSSTTTTTTAVHRGPQFIYPFLDTTLPGYQTTYCLLGLLAVLLLSHLLFCFADTCVKRSPWISVPFIAAAVCRFSD
jgi:hypothetical protein